MKLLDVLAEKVLISDGAMGTQIHERASELSDFVLKAEHCKSKTAMEAAMRLDGAVLEGCNELLSLTRADIIAQIHQDYLAAGADLIQTNTFGASSIVLSEYQIPELLYDLCLASAQIARQEVDRASNTHKPRFVLGAIGPGTKLVSLGQTTWPELEESYATGFKGLLEGGADALMVETLQDLLMVKATLVAAQRAMAESGREVPVLVSVTMEQTGTMLLGTELQAALNMIECFPFVKVFGINCATGPVEMATHVRFLGENSTRPILVQPNAGLPVMENGGAVYRLSPEELAAYQRKFVQEHGAAIVGGCCGTTPAHIKALAQELGDSAHSGHGYWQKVRQLFPGFDFSMKTDEQATALKLVGCSSLYQFQPYQQDSSFLIIGEKTNANGSKAFREMLGTGNWDGLVELARELESEGSHVLDVCAAYVGRDEASDMSELLCRYNQHITVPIMIDSTEVEVVERSLQCLAGKPIINSINFEDGEERTQRVLALCKQYGAAVVALTIDEDGMAKTAQKKVEIAERILGRTREFGLPDHDVFLDCLTFTLGSGDEEFRKAGAETVEAIREVRSRHPRVNTVLGISNISFGLKPAARLVLNSSFLHFCLEAGLTAAIVHYSKIKPESQIEPDVWSIATDLVFDRRRFEQVPASQTA